MVANVQNSTVLGLSQYPQAPGRAGDARGPDRVGDAAYSRAQDVDDAGASALAALRDGLARAQSVLDLTLAGGRAALAAFAEGRARGDVEGGLAAFVDQIGSAIAAGAAPLSGEALRVALEPGVEPFEIAGADLRGLLPAGQDAAALDGFSASVEGALDRFAAAARRLDVHAGLVGRLDAAVAGGLNVSLDADSARLAALQISQALAERPEGLSASAPQTILALFRG